MFDFSDEQKMAQKMLRQWCEKELAPHVRAMERGELLPYELMRKLGRTFGLDEMIRAFFRRMEEKASGGESVKTARTDEYDEGALFASDPGMSAIVAIELARTCPGFALAFGASLG